MIAPKLWTDDRVDTLLGHLKAGKTTTQIGNSMGLSRSAVSGQIHRMKRTHNDRLMASGYGAMVERGFNGGECRKANTVRLTNEFAELLSLGVSFRHASIQLHISETHADRLFARIRRSLGWQAR